MHQPVSHASSKQTSSSTSPTSPSATSSLSSSSSTTDEELNPTSLPSPSFSSPGVGDGGSHPSPSFSLPGVGEGGYHPTLFFSASKPKNATTAAIASITRSPRPKKTDRVKLNVAGNNDEDDNDDDDDKDDDDDEENKRNHDFDDTKNDDNSNDNSDNSKNYDKNNDDDDDDDDVDDTNKEPDDRVRERKLEGVNNLNGDVYFKERSKLVDGKGRKSQEDRQKGTFSSDDKAGREIGRNDGAETQLSIESKLERIPCFHFREPEVGNSSISVNLLRDCGRVSLMTY